MKKQIREANDKADSARDSLVVVGPPEQAWPYERCVEKAKRASFAPDYPRKRTSAPHHGMSHECHNRL
jgi:hypothetical protein